MSVIFSAALFGFGYVAAAASSIAEQIVPPALPFELSQDGETLWQGEHVYDFAGFTDGCDFSSSVGRGVKVRKGKRIGYVENEEGTAVRHLETPSGEFVCLEDGCDEQAVYSIRS